MTPPIPLTAAYLLELRKLVEPAEAMQRNGFITQLLTDEELLLKRHCLGCGKTMSQLERKASSPRQPIPTDRVTGAQEKRPTPVPKLAINAAPAPSASDSDPLSEPAVTRTNAFRCKFHPGGVYMKQWTCCHKHVSAEPCGGSDSHNPPNSTPAQLAKQYQVHYTPFVPARGADIRAAVAIDCEMGTNELGEPELIRVTLVDYFTKEVLVDNLVDPDVGMKHLNTQYSGVTWTDMRMAQIRGTQLRGKSGARSAVWRYVGLNTVVVGHGVSNDLRALRWVHMLVVDSHVIEYGFFKRKEAELAATEAAKKAIEDAKAVEMDDETSLLIGAVGSWALRADTPVEVSGDKGNEAAAETQKKKKKKKGSGKLALKTLVEQRLHRKIQTGGKAGHDSLEDAIAARDLVHWIIMNPDFER